MNLKDSQGGTAELRRQDAELQGGIAELRRRDAELQGGTVTMI
jgi:hypothetical protein